MRPSRSRARTIWVVVGPAVGLVVAVGVIAWASSAGYGATYGERPSPSASPSASVRPVVAVVERLADADGVSSLALGRVLTQELNCLACHADGRMRGKRAPVLTDVAGRVRPDHMQRFIARPGSVKRGTTMPDLFGGVSETERASSATAITHYLMSLSDERPRREYVPPGGRRRGEKLYHDVGCAACHDPQAAGSAALPTSTPLGDLAVKYTQASLAKFLHDPLSVRPDGRMPGLNLAMSEARDIAAYLMPPGNQRPGIRYHYFPGEWHEFPEFARMRPSASGSTKAITAALGRGNWWYGLRFTGSLTLARQGRYTFHVRSGDEARLTVDGDVVVEQRAEGAPTWESGSLTLAAGRHDVAMDFMARQHGEDLGYSPADVDAGPEEHDPDAGFDEWDGGGDGDPFDGGEGSRDEYGDFGEFEEYGIDVEDARAELSVEFDGPGLRRQPIERALNAGPPAPAPKAAEFVVDRELAARGRRLFVTVGCASCHEVMESGARVETELVAPDLLGLTAGGCLAADESDTPRYRLDGWQTRLMGEYLATVTSGSYPPAQAPGDDIRHTMLTLNCFACHARGGVGGVEYARDAFFQTTEREVGDEARIPPPLDGVGAKLTEEWLADVVATGANDRPAMLTRMPSFGAANVDGLAAQLALSDRMDPLPRVTLDAPGAKSAGRDMVGGTGFACTTCHPFGRYEATGLQSMSLTLMASRLREDWFRRYVADPAKYRGVTRMPAAWPLDEPSYLTSVLGGDTDSQIQAVWFYLTDGADAKTPAGLGDRFLELIPEDEAIIYRNFIEGAGPRAIGVGFPEGVHIAFDANDARLALVWRGGFIDAGRHWNDRGEGFQPPLGADVLALPEGVALARLPSADAPWPEGRGKELDVVFEGYRLTADHRPTFMYRLGGLKVEDTPNPVGSDGGTALRRLLTFRGSAGGGVWFRAARGSITQNAEGVYAFRGMRMRIETNGAAPVMRSRDGVDEVLVPVSPSTAMTQTFRFVGGGDVDRPDGTGREGE